MEENKIILGSKDLPRAWYNLLAEIGEEMAPPLHPVTKKPVEEKDLAPIFPRL